MIILIHEQSHYLSYMSHSAITYERPSITRRSADHSAPFTRYWLTRYLWYLWGASCYAAVQYGYHCTENVCVCATNSRTRLDVCAADTHICVPPTHTSVCRWHTHLCAADTHMRVPLTHRCVCRWHTHVCQRHTSCAGYEASQGPCII